MIGEFARFLVKELDGEIANYTGDLARGQPANYEEYRRLVGVIQGLTLARDRIKDLAQRAEDANDD